MALQLNDKYLEAVQRGKYAPLYSHLRLLQSDEWSATFGEIEAILGFPLPVSARLYRPWWANQKRGNGHSQALAWGIAGWRTAEVDMERETLSFKREEQGKHSEGSRPKFDLDKVIPPRSIGSWPEDLSLRREDLYPDRV